MHEFKDSNGTAWTVDINIDARNQVKASVPAVDFYEVDCIAKLADKQTLGETLAVLCREQIEKRGTTERDFFRAIKGDVWDRIADALHEELCDFFQSGERQLVRKALSSVKTLRATALAKVNEILESPALQDRLAKTLSEPFTDSPAGSAGSTPDPSRSAA